MTTNTEILFAGPRKEAEDVCMPCLVNYKCIVWKKRVSYVLIWADGCLPTLLLYCCCFIVTMFSLLCN